MKGATSDLAAQMVVTEMRRFSSLSAMGSSAANGLSIKVMILMVKVCGLTNTVVHLQDRLHHSHHNGEYKAPHQ